jgi:hypothetical protein
LSLASLRENGGNKKADLLGIYDKTR